jgi:hypothetical protein
VRGRKPRRAITDQRDGSRPSGSPFRAPPASPAVNIKVYGSGSDPAAHLTDAEVQNEHGSL